MTLEKTVIAMYVVYAILRNILAGGALRLVGERYKQLGILSLCVSGH